MSDEILFDGVRYISAREVGDEFSLTQDYVARLARLGKVRGRRVGRNWYIDINGFRAYMHQQAIERKKRKESLSAERSREYHGNAASARVHAGGVPAHTAIASQGGALSGGSSSEPVDMVHAALLRALHARPVARAVETRAHAPLYATSPLLEFLNRVAALVTAFMLTFGTYAIVDGQYARFAVDTARAHVAYVKDAAHRVMGADYAALAAAVRESVADVAQEPERSLASVGHALLPLSSIARSVNKYVDSMVEEYLFRGTGIERGSVVVEIVPRSPDIVPTSIGDASPAAVFVTNHPVVERIIERERAAPMVG
ncbi:hypothetical protein COU20_02220, partial [Candidatus Kaiserbacteria bacterium CG10_big_fil_rev_8_21_14_0_10_59_10]